MTDAAFKRTSLLASLLLATVASAAERHYDKNFPVGPGAELSLDSHKGTIRIRTHDHPVIHAHARIHADDPESAELLDFVQIEERASERRVAISVEHDQRPKREGTLVSRNWSLPLVDWDILVPEDADLNLDSHKSKFDLQVPSGRITIDSHKGTGTIRGVRNDFDLDTHKGHFEIQVMTLGDLNVDTHKGHVTITIHDAHDFTVVGESHKGELRFSGRDIRVYRDEDDDKELHVDHREGSGEHHVDLDTHKGTIRLKFIDD